MTGTAIGGWDGSHSRASPTVAAARTSVNSHTLVEPDVPATNCRVPERTRSEMPASRAVTNLDSQSRVRTDAPMGVGARHVGHDPRPHQTAPTIPRMAGVPSTVGPSSHGTGRRVGPTD